jgi:hypothetical protein
MGAVVVGALCVKKATDIKAASSSSPTKSPQCVHLSKAVLLTPTPLGVGCWLQVDLFRDLAKPVASRSASTSTSTSPSEAPITALLSSLGL